MVSIGAQFLQHKGKYQQYAAINDMIVNSVFGFTAQILYQFYFETQLCNSKTKKFNLYFINFKIPSLISNFVE